MVELDDKTIENPCFSTLIIMIVVGALRTTVDGLTLFTGLQGSPSGGPSVMAQEVFALVRQANGRYVRHVLHRPVQSEHGHVESVGLWRELEERVNADLAHAERVGRQWFHRRVDDVVAQRHLHLSR